ncbi:hypothetical protein AC578_625 [Pseudocercospora eumusae]|uniref:Protein kinase domain-containing protein n=1 Tax=Pseudocercospora eumusae TaxID=321146 RepID=A0A139HFN0_9PEZI|nr:hypothetical protein AC578_625 [Pseudocercospora eumusae]
MARTRSGSNASAQATGRGRSKSATPVPAPGAAGGSSKVMRRSKRLAGAEESNGGDSSDEDNKPRPGKSVGKISVNSKRGRKGKKKKKKKDNEEEDQEAAVDGLSIIKEDDEEDEAAFEPDTGQRPVSPQRLNGHGAPADPSTQDALRNDDIAEVPAPEDEDIDTEQQTETTSPRPENGCNENGDNDGDSSATSHRSPTEDGNAPPALDPNGPSTSSTHSSLRDLFDDPDDDAEDFESPMNGDADEANGVPAVPGELGGAAANEDQAEGSAIGSTLALAESERSPAMPVVSEPSKAGDSHGPGVGHLEDAAMPREGVLIDDETRQKSRKRKSSDLASETQPSQGNGSKSKRPRVDSSGQTRIPTQPEQEHDSSHKLTAEEANSWNSNWMKNWQVLHGNGCSLAECNEYRELYAKAVEIQEDAGIAVPPPGEWGGMYVKRIPRAHLDNTRAKLKRKYMDHVEGLWTTYINRVASRGDSQHPEKTARMAEKERVRMKKHAAKPTGWPYKPNDEPADVPPLSPEVKGGKLAVELGFGLPQSLPPTLQGTWNFSHSLGVGAYGHAGLWEQFDQAGNIIKRIAVKETYLPGSKFTNAMYWATDKRPQLPKEGVMMQDLNRLPTSTNIVKCHAMAGDFWYAQHKLQRLYLEYCPHGDLQSMIGEHRLLQERKAADGRSINHRIPVNLLWSVFEALISATCLMKNGCLPPNQALAGWTPMLHRDIKPANIVLTPPSNVNSRNVACWPGIPVPKLADFGIGTYIDSKNEPKNSWLRSNPFGTLGYMAPERLITSRPPADPSKIDIWSSARVILALMNLDEKEEDVFHYAGENSEDILHFKDGVRDYYDDRCPKLVGMVERCLSEDPGLRPGVEDLWQEIQNEVARYGDLDMEVLPLKQTAIGDDEPLARYKMEPWPMWSR